MKRTVILIILIIAIAVLGIFAFAKKLNYQEKVIKFPAEPAEETTQEKFQPTADQPKTEEISKEKPMEKEPKKETEKISIITVYDNYQVDPNLTTSWGFGCVVKTPDKTILFDTGGDSPTLLSNMEKMGLDPKDIDIVVISHIHGDHIGGLYGFLEKNANVKVYIPASFPNSYRDKIKSYGAEYQDVRDSIQISDIVWTTGELPGPPKEQSLVLDTEKGLVVITGCAHPGVVDITKKAKQMLLDKNVYLVMGGFHLTGAGDTQLKDIIRSFRDLGVQKAAPSHCSGDRSRELFKQEFKESFIENGVGKMIEI